MSIFKISAAAVLATLSVSAFVLPANAASVAQAMSPATQRFLDNLTPNVDFLDRASRIAILDTKSVKVRDFAKSTATDATNTANALYDWTQAGKGAEAPLQTGRSVAVDQAADTRLPRGQEDIDALYGAEGSEFDAQYKQAQIDALTQVQADYQDYIAHGDDAALKALAVKELPKVTKRLVAAQKI